jgi:tRNA G10  N-methylase Trm11
MKYFFIPGHEWDLSLAELKNLLSVYDYPYVELKTHSDIFLFDINCTIEEAVDLFDQLGGFVRFGFIVKEPYEYLEDNVLEEAQKRSSRVNFSVSLLGDHTRLHSMKREKNKLGMDLKRWLKSKSIKCRFVSDFKKPKSSTVLLDKNDVLDEGFELDLILIPKSDKREWGFTLGIQDFENFSKRDYERPRSNKEKGMIPPKLARIMINLARNSDTKDQTIWDPFCGSGTILQEAMVLGFKALGTDVDNLSIEESKENLSWLSEEYMISHKNYEVFQHDVTKPFENSLNFSFIATEPYLGPIQTSPLSVSEVETVLQKLTPLYKGIQNRIANQGNHGRLSIVVPGFNTGKNWMDMDFPLDEDNGLKDITSDLSSTPLQWDRQHSIIRRNIKVYEY